MAEWIQLTPWRQVTRISALVVALLLALPLSVMGWGYAQAMQGELERRLSERRLTPIIDAAGRLVGAMHPSRSPGAVQQGADVDYIEFRSDVPTAWLQALMALEDRNYDTAWSVCGIDMMAIPRVVRHRFKVGGSSLIQQVARNIMLPDWREDAQTPPWRVVVRKWLEMGYGCALHQRLTERGGDKAVHQLLASYMPVAQGLGTLRGIEPGSRVLFDKAPSELNIGEQLVLAAAVQLPLRDLPESDEALTCGLVWPRAGNPDYDAAKAGQHGAWQAQCRVFARAEKAAHLLYAANAETLASALQQIDALRRQGIRAVNPFTGISTRRLINLDARTNATLAADLRTEVRDALENTPHAAEVRLALDLKAQSHSLTAMRDALAAAKEAPGAGLLCASLDGKPQLTRPLLCPPIQGDVPRVEWLGITFDLVGGAVSSRVTSMPGLLNERLQLGSLTKVIINAAAIVEGRSGDSRVCPRQAKDGARPLRRETPPHHGFAHCQGGRNTISIEEMTARSDGLAAYELARELGEPSLRRVLQALGLTPDDSTSLAFQLAFGTSSATVAELTRASQAVFAVAYGMRVTSVPWVLQQQKRANPAATALAGLMPRDEQRAELRRLLQAPVQHAAGTMRQWREVADGGKSATNQSPVLDPTGRRFMASRLWLLHDARTGQIGLFVATTASPTVPLALHNLPSRVFDAPLRVLMTGRFSRN